MYPDGVRDNMGLVHLPSACGHGHESLAAAMQGVPTRLPCASPMGFAVCLLRRLLMGIRTTTREGVSHGKAWKV